MSDEDFIQEAYVPDEQSSFKHIDKKNELFETTISEPTIEIKPKVEEVVEKEPEVKPVKEPKEVKIPVKPKVQKKPVEKRTIVEKKPIEKKVVAKKPTKKVVKKILAKKPISKPKITKKNIDIKKKASSMYNSIKKSAKNIDFTNKAKINNIITISAVIAIIIISAFILNINKLMPDNGTPLAIINGEVLTSKDVEATLRTVPEAYKAILDDKEVLNQTIMNKVLLQESQKLGLEATDEDVEETLTQIREQVDLNQKEFEDYLETQEMNLKDLKAFYKLHLSIENLLQKVAYNQINITDQEVKDFYEETGTLENLTFEEVEEQIQLYLEQQAQADVFEEYANTLMVTAEIKILNKEETTTSFSSEEVEKYSSCAVEKGLTKDTVIFVHTDTCPHCVKMKPVVTGLEGEGYTFKWANAANASARELLKECFNDVLEGGVPQFICAKNGQNIVGEKPESVLRDFAESCK